MQLSWPKTIFSLFVALAVLSGSCCCSAQTLVKKDTPQATHSCCSQKKSPLPDEKQEHHSCSCKLTIADEQRPIDLKSAHKHSAPKSPDEENTFSRFITPLSHNSLSTDTAQIFSDWDIPIYVSYCSYLL